nr:retrovirus-related Pol polyprotein from transposon TNT 1-94 [Tanacetum cinerariifolium]
MGELTFFLGLQVKQKQDGIFINQDKYVAKILRRFGLTNGKSASTPIDTEKPVLKDPDEESIRQALRLDDADSIDCLPNEEIFVELACMGYEKPSTKLTFYKAFFLAHWKFLIHIILQCISAKRTAWNEFSSSMALAIICLATEDEDDVNEVSADPTSPLPTLATPLPPPQPEHIPSPLQAETAQPSPPT